MVIVYIQPPNSSRVHAIQLLKKQLIYITNLKIFGIIISHEICQHKILLDIWHGCCELFDTQKSTHVGEKLIKVLHKRDLALAVDRHGECGRSEVVEGLQEALFVRGIRLGL